MSILVRRSNLPIPAADRAALESAWRHNADAITLVAGKSADAAVMKAAIPLAGRGAAEVFARVERADRHAGIDAAVWPGLNGLVLADVLSAAEIEEADRFVTKLEGDRGLAKGSIGFIVLFETGRAVCDMRAILGASKRITQAGLDEAALARNLGFKPDPALDPFDYARGRLAVECTAAGIGAIGMSYPLSVLPREEPHTELHTAATKARNLGMKGVLCPFASWVAPVNEAFTPTAERVTYYKRVREVFAAGVAAGTAAVPLDGRMIDVPVDEWAIVVLAIAEACAARDAVKTKARSALS
jgi:citrate lyase subunit beta/citryl-CoA lyase